MPNCYVPHPRDPDAENLEVEFVITSYGDPGNTFGLPENCWPPEPAQFDIMAARLEAGDGPDILSQLTPEEYEALEAEVYDSGDFSPPSDDWD